MKVEIKVSEDNYSNEKDLKAKVQIVLDDMYKMIGIEVREKVDEQGPYLATVYPGYEPAHDSEKKTRAYFGPAENEEAASWWVNVLERKIINSVALLNKSGINNIFVRADVPNVSTEDIECNVHQFLRDDVNLKGYGSVVFGGIFKVDGLRVLGSKNNPDSLYVSNPSYNTGKYDQDGRPKYQDYFYPVVAAAREKLNTAFIEAYKEEVGISMGIQENTAFGAIDKEIAVFIKGMGATIFYKDGRNLVEFDTPEDIEKYDGLILCSFDEANYYKGLAEKMEDKKQTKAKTK